MNCDMFTRLGQKVLKFKFVIEVIIIFIKSIKKGIKWYVHFIGKSIIWTVVHLPKFLHDSMLKIGKFWEVHITA